MSSPTLAQFYAKARNPELRASERFMMRFLSKVKIRTTVGNARPELGPCWIWTAGTDKDGYGRIQWLRKARRAARLALRMTQRVGKLQTDHLCEIVACVNPDHLVPATARQNVLKNRSPIAVYARKTHCVRGHLLAGANLLNSKSGYRLCKICKRLAGRRWRRKHPILAKRASQQSNRRRQLKLKLQREEKPNANQA